jgi:hypothetical protein
MALLVVVEVRPADTDPADAQKDHSGFKFRAAERLDANISGGVEDGGFHVIGHDQGYSGGAKTTEVRRDVPLSNLPKVGVSGDNLFRVV